MLSVVMEGKRSLFFKRSSQQKQEGDYTESNHQSKKTVNVQQNIVLRKKGKDKKVI